MAKLGVDDLVGPIGLSGVESIPGDWACCEVSKLQSGRVDPLDSENNLKAVHRPPMIGTVTDAAEGKFQGIVLPFPTLLDNNVCLPGVLALVPKKGISALHTEAQGDVIGVFRVGVLVGEPVLVDHSGDNREVGTLDDLVQAFHEGYALCLRLEKNERGLLFSDVVLVQDNKVVAKMLELESLYLWHNRRIIILFLEDAEIENKDRKILINNL